MARPIHRAPPPWERAPGLPAAADLGSGERAPDQRVDTPARGDPAAGDEWGSWPTRQPRDGPGRHPSRWGGTDVEPAAERRSAQPWPPSVAATPRVRSIRSRLAARWRGAGRRGARRRSPRYRMLGLVATVTTIAVIGAVDLPPGGPSPPAPPLAAVDGPVVNGAGTASGQLGGELDPADPSGVLDGGAAPGSGSASDPASGSGSNGGGEPTGGPSADTGQAPEARTDDERGSDDSAGARGGAGSARDTGPGGGAGGRAAGGDGRPRTTEPAADGDASRQDSLLAVREVARLGPVVVDSAGFTLYRYDGDASGVATCTDACTSTWTPVTVDPSARPAVEGWAGAALGVVRRPDGETQLTVQGWPIYRFVGDTRPGLHGGHGLGRVWHAITPEGGRAGES